MALAARCPHCHALFRVVADQLKLRGGLVRCGACREVFDAIGSLSYVDDHSLITVQPDAPIGGTAVPGPPAIAAAAAPAQPAPSPPDRPVGPPREVERAPGRPREPVVRRERERSDPLSIPTVLGAMTVDPSHAASVANAPELSIVPAATRAAPPMPAHSAQLTGPGSEAPAPDSVVQDQAPLLAPEPSTGAPAEEAGSDAGPDAASFLAEPETPRERRWRRIASIACAPLAALAAVQLLLALREPAMEAWPELRPTLVRLCGWYGCTAGWPAHAELLAIVGSELVSIPGTDVVELNAGVRSRAAFTMALPAIEVTLTDTQNRTIARKVFLPVDYLASSAEPSSRIDEGLPPNTDFSLHLVFEARGLNASGFVVYPFYL